MGVTYSNAKPYNYADAQTRSLKQQKVLSRSPTEAITDVWEGVKEENLVTESKVVKEKNLEIVSTEVNNIHIIIIHICIF